jgi:hypothetical protein
MVHILSFDIGIKNLAYCYLDFSGNLQDTMDQQVEPKILDWGVIDILNEINNDCIRCGVMNKKGNICNKVAVNYVDINDKKVGFCGNKTCQSRMSLSYPPDQNNVNIKKIKKITTKSLSLIDMGRTMVQELDKKNNFLNADIIVLENQPVLKNPTMKSIQMILYSYFLIRGDPQMQMQLFSAKNKLNVYNGPDIVCNKKGDYAKRKYLSVEYTKYFLKNNLPKLQWFLEHTKKDDLADSYLQGMTYYNNIHLKNTVKSTKKAKKSQESKEIGKLKGPKGKKQPVIESNL